jgi:hypothetical protein
MGLRTLQRDIFSPAFVEALRGAPEAAMDAVVRVFDPMTIQAVLDPETNTYSNTFTPLYTGIGRVQPLRSANQTTDAGNATTVQNVLFSIPISNKALDLRPGLQATVLSSELNPVLTKYQYVIKEIIDSSNPIEKTFLCTVNQEIALS